MGSNHLVIIFTIVIGIFACNADKNKDKVKFHDLSPDSNIVGLWNIKNLEVKDNGYLKNSGEYNIFFRANNTFAVELNNFNLRLENDILFEECFLFKSGKYSMESGVIKFTDVVTGPVKGECLDFELPTLLSSEDENIETTISSDQKIISLNFNFTKNDDNGDQVDYVVKFYLYKNADDPSDGTYPDVGFNGAWLTTGVFVDTKCDAMSTGKAELPLKGENLITIDGTSYTQKQDDFAVASDVLCTGEASGTVEQGEFLTKLHEEVASPDCIKDNSASLKGYQVFLERNFLAGPNRSVDFIHYELAKTKCENTKETVKVIQINERN